MKKKFIKVVLTMVAILSVTSMISFAGEWKQDNAGWWYQNDDGSYPSSSWKEVDGKQYYFDQSGYMLHDTTTPDGYQVGSDGVWLQENEQVLDSQNLDDDKMLAIRTMSSLLWSLKDPDSLRVSKVYCQTIYLNGSQELRQAVIKYSATNSFGGRVTSYYSAWISPNTGKLLTDTNFKNVTQKTLSNAIDKVELDKDMILEKAQILVDGYDGF
jgi:hypothetical protein